MLHSGILQFLLFALVSLEYPGCDKILLTKFLANMLLRLPVELRLLVYSHLFPTLWIKKEIRVSDTLTRPGIRIKMSRSPKGSTEDVWRTLRTSDDQVARDVYAASLAEVTAYASLWTACRTTQSDLQSIAESFTLVFECPWEFGGCGRQYYDTDTLRELANSRILQRAAFPWSHCTAAYIVLQSTEKVPLLMDVFRTFIHAMSALKPCVPQHLLQRIWLEAKVFTSSRHLTFNWPKYCRLVTHITNQVITQVEWKRIDRRKAVSLSSRDYIFAAEKSHATGSAKFWFGGLSWSLVRGECDNSYTDLSLCEPWSQGG